MLKAIAYRAVAFAIEWLLILAILGEPRTTTMLVVICLVVNTLVYYVFEKAWDRFRRKHASKQS